jgi:hypothetical protein
VRRAKLLGVAIAGLALFAGAWASWKQVLAGKDLQTAAASAAISGCSSSFASRVDISNPLVPRAPLGSSTSCSRLPGRAARSEVSCWATLLVPGGHAGGWRDPWCSGTGRRARLRGARTPAVCSTVCHVEHPNRISGQAQIVPFISLYAGLGLARKLRRRARATSPAGDRGVRPAGQSPCRPRARPRALHRSCRRAVEAIT